jgi:hypothetical protein
MNSADYTFGHARRCSSVMSASKRTRCCSLWDAVMVCPLKRARPAAAREATTATALFARPRPNLTQPRHVTLTIENPPSVEPRRADVRATRFVADLAASPFGNHLARVSRLARASALLLMQGQVWRNGLGEEIVKLE